MHGYLALDLKSPRMESKGMTFKSKSSTVGGDESLKRVERLADDFRHLEERWNNRLVLENGSLWEGYLKGDFEIALYGEAFEWGPEKYLWCVRIPACREFFKDLSPNKNAFCVDFTDSDHGNEIVVFVVVAQAGGGPQMEVRVPARFYFFRDEFRSVGEGLLYSAKGLGSFEVFPFCRERKMELLSRSNATGGCIHPQIEAFPEVVHSIANNCAGMLRDRLFGKIGELIAVRLPQSRYGSIGHPEAIKLFPGGSLKCDHFVNVAIGPFNLHTG